MESKKTNRCIIIGNETYKGLSARDVTTRTEIQKIRQQKNTKVGDFKPQIECIIPTDERDSQTMILYNMFNKIDEDKTENYEDDVIGIINDLNDTLSNATVIAFAIPPTNGELNSEANTKIREINERVQNKLETDMRTVFINSWDILTEDGKQILYENPEDTEISEQGEQIIEQMRENVINNSDKIESTRVKQSKTPPLPISHE